MDLFDDTPEYMRSSNDADGDAEYLGATYTRPVEAPKAPATSPAAQALALEEERKKQAAAQAAGDAEAQRRARELAEFKAKQAAIDAAKQRDIEAAQRLGAKIGVPTAKPGTPMPTSRPIPVAPAAPTYPAAPAGGFVPSTPADVEAAMAAGGGSLPLDLGAPGRPMWQYAVGGALALGGLYVLGRFVVLPMVRR